MKEAPEMPKSEERRIGGGDEPIREYDITAPKSVAMAIAMEDRMVFLLVSPAVSKREESAKPSPNLWKMTANEAVRPREGEKRKVEPTAMPSTKL